MLRFLLTATNNCQSHLINSVTETASLIHLRISNLPFLLCLSGMKCRAGTERGTKHSKLEMAELTAEKDNVQPQQSPEHSDTKFWCRKQKGSEIAVSFIYKAQVIHFIYLLYTINPSLCTDTLDVELVKIVNTI